MPSTTRRMPSWTLARVFSLTARIVPSISAVSGITLFVVPAVIRPTVITDGSNTSTVRVIISLQRLDHLAGHRDRVGGPVRLAGVTALAGDGDRQPVGRRHQRPASAAQPARRQRRGDVQGEGAGDRRRRAVGQRRDVEQPLLEHEPRPVVALLAGLEHEQHPPRDVVAMRSSAAWRRRRASPCGCRARRRASSSSTREAKSSPVSSCIGRASMSPRSRIVGPGAAPVSMAAMPLVVSWIVRSSGRPSSALEHVLLGDRQLVADLGPLVQRAAQLDGRRRADRSLLRGGRPCRGSCGSW